MKIGIACDHGGFDLKNILNNFLKEKDSFCASCFRDKNL